jgi:hypothetical protein
LLLDEDIGFQFAVWYVGLQLSKFVVFKLPSNWDADILPVMPNQQRLVENAEFID